jgi:NAD(P)-dependent dehydrogenase (short-subunit alcohol dehydrogenase family)
MVAPASFANALVVTGGSSGIGAALAMEAANRGYGVVFGGSRPFERLDPSLRDLSAQYVQVDVRDAGSVDRFRDEALAYLGERNPRLLVVACAGVATRESQEAIEDMRRINVDGTRHLLRAFAEPLRSGEGNRFVAVSSIVAAEGKSVKGDEAYQATKAEVHRIATEETARDYPGVRGFTLAPGAVKTPMTTGEMIFSMLLLGALSQTETPIYRRLLEIGGLEKAEPAELLRALLGDALTATPNYAKVDEVLKKYPKLGRAGLIFLKYAGSDPAVIERAAEALIPVDVAIRPQVMAPPLLNQFESGEIPLNGMLKVYSEGGADPILGLLSSFG